MRQTGTANIGSNLAQRGLLDSSLFPGALSNLEQNIAQTRNPMSDDYWRAALGLGQQAGNTIGNLSQIYLLKQLLENNPSSFTGTNLRAPWAGPSYNAQPYPGFG